MMVEKAILKLPHVQRALADRDRRLERDTARKYVLRVLHQRLGPVPKDVASQLAAIQEQEQRDRLHDVAAVCPDLEAFRKAMAQ